MQLQDIQPQRGQGGGERDVVRVDEEPDAGWPAGC